VKHVQDLLVNIGLEADRVRMFNLSSAMAGQFAESARQMTEQIRKIGPNPLNDRNYS
jgi:coenzyme F420-reducing hydrogenase delta subunit